MPSPTYPAPSRWSPSSVSGTTKRALLDALLTLRVDAALSPLTRGRAAVFMLHRFRDDERGVVGHEPRIVRRALAKLRSDGFQLLSIGDVVSRLAGDGPPLERAVCFTIDDGYLEQATVAGPLFAEFDCPVTTFVTSGFLDRDLWFWWDQIEYVMLQSPRSEVRVAHPQGDLRYSLHDGAHREHARGTMVAYCKTVSDATKHELIAALARAAEVDLPGEAPPQYSPMSWNELRRCEELGMTFGPHTVTHPILSRTSDAQSLIELRDGWIRLQTEACRPVPVFCYPNGQFTDFSTRETMLLRELGLTAAVVGEPGYADSRSFRAGAHAPYRIRRFAFPDDLPNLIQLSSGIERLKRILRRESDG